MERYRVLFREYYLFGINNEKIGIKKYLPDKIPERHEKPETIIPENNYGRNNNIEIIPEEIITMSKYQE